MTAVTLAVGLWSSHDSLGRTPPSSLKSGCPLNQDDALAATSGIGRDVSRAYRNMPISLFLREKAVAKLEVVASLRSAACLTRTRRGTRLRSTGLVED